MIDIDESRRRAWTFWGLSGIPVGSVAIQALAVVFGVEVNELPIVGVFASALHEIRVFEQASFGLQEQPGLIVGLFLLIAVAWVVLGTTLPRSSPYNLREEDVRIGAVSISALLYFTLFVGVYWNVWTGTAPILQRIAFIGVPVLGTGSLYLVYFVYPKPTTEQLERAQSDLKVLKNEFRELRRDRLGQPVLDRIREVSDDIDVDPNPVDVAEDDLESFQETFSEIESELESLEKNTDIEPEERNAQARGLRDGKIEALDPQGRIDSIEESLLETLTEEVRNEFDGFSYRSRYGESYTIQNYSRYRTIRTTRVRSPELGAELSVGSVGEKFEAFVGHENTGLAECATLLEVVYDHFHGSAGVVDDIERKEDEYAETEGELFDLLNEIEDEITSIGGAVGDRLREVYVDGRGRYIEGLDTIGVVERDGSWVFAEGRTLLHDCQFEEAQRAVRDAVDMASEIYRSIGYINEMTMVVEDGDEEISVYRDPRSFTYDVFDYEFLESLESAFATEYGVGFEVDRATGTIEFVEDPSETKDVEVVDEDSSDGKTPVMNTRTESRDTDPLTDDGVKHVLSNLVKAAERQNGEPVQFNPDNVADVFDRKAVYVELNRYFESRDDLVNDFVVPLDGEEYIQIESAPSLNTQRAVRKLQREYSGQS